MDDVSADGDAEFQQKVNNFETINERFRVLCDALEAYRDAITAVTTTGVAVADALASFLEHTPNSGSGGTSAVATGNIGLASSGIGRSASPDGLDSTTSAIAVAFRTAQTTISRNWSHVLMQKFDADVHKGVQDSLDQFPQVWEYVKQRGAAQQDMLKRQKKLKDAGARGRDRQRKWRECSDRFNMFDFECMQRFSNIDRAQLGLVSKPMRTLVSLLGEISRDAATAFEEVVALLSIPTPSMTREFEPPPRHDPLVNSTSALLPEGVEDEGWDNDFDFRNSDAAQEPFRSDVKPLLSGERAKEHHSRTRSALAIPSKPSVPETSRRAASGPPSALTRNRGVARDALSAAEVAASSSPVGHLTKSALADVDGLDGKDAVWDQESRSEKDKVLMRLAATFDFTPSETNELPLKTGVIIEVYEQHSSGWWIGRANHVTGYFPRNHARPISEEEELNFITERSRRRRERRRGHRRKDSLTTSHSSVAASGANDETVHI